MICNSFVSSVQETGLGCCIGWEERASIQCSDSLLSFFERGLTSCPGSRGTAASPTPIQQNSPPLTNVSIRERDRCMRVIAIASPTELPAKIRPCTNPKSTSSRFRPSERRPTHQNHRTTTNEILATHRTLLGEDRRRDGDLGS